MVAVVGSRQTQLASRDGKRAHRSRVSSSGRKVLIKSHPTFERSAPRFASERRERRQCCARSPAERSLRPSIIATLAQISAAVDASDRPLALAAFRAPFPAPRRAALFAWVELELECECELERESQLARLAAASGGREPKLLRLASVEQAGPCKAAPICMRSKWTHEPRN